MSATINARSVTRSQAASVSFRSQSSKAFAPKGAKGSFKTQRSLVITAIAPGETKWFPGAVSPSYLDGSMAGDYGFDPLRLGADTGAGSPLPYYREAELMNGRWAMTATLGIVATELLGLPKWYEAGALDYNLDTTALIGVEVLVMGFLEACRIDGFNKTGETGLLYSYPFDPLGLAVNSDTKKELQLKELKNARLAMVAFLGMASQYAVTGMAPVECLKKHLEDPFHNNLFTSSVGLESTVAVIAFSLAPMVINADRAISGQEASDEPPITWGPKIPAEEA